MLATTNSILLAPYTWASRSSRIRAIPFVTSKDVPGGASIRATIWFGSTLGKNSTPLLKMPNRTNTTTSMASEPAITRPLRCNAHFRVLTYFVCIQGNTTPSIS